MLHIHFANHLESLGGLLVDRIGAAAGSAFDVDEVIVPSAAMQRHLTLALARQHGICANVRFSYLARWLWQQIGRVVPDVQAESPFDPSVLAWRIYAAFGDAAWLRAHARLAAYLERADAAMRFELAMRVAALFDQYLTYRPEWLAAWLRGEPAALGKVDTKALDDHDWQAALWRRLARETRTDDRHPVTSFVQALAAEGGDAAWRALPRAVHVFALPALPPLHLGLLHTLAWRTEVHLYALNPCREYWFELVDRKRLGYLAARGRAAHHEEGHRLLAAWGQQARSQLGQLVDASGDATIDDAHFTAQPGDSLLARLHNGMLDLVDLLPGSVGPNEHDRSIEIHVCHSLTREIEVLHDRLLALFAMRDAPAPGDVLVATPDLEAAAPLIDAIFGTAPKERHIPYAITGRKHSEVNPAAHALLELLSLATSRCTVSVVFGLLQQPIVARRFGLDAGSLEQVRQWLQDAGVHWALDAAHRASFGVPAVARHSFADGLDRLFLGHALPTHVEAPFDGRLPAGDAEGSAALALGALWRFVDALAALRRAVSVPQPASAWPGLLADALGNFVAARDGELEDLREVHAALEALGEQWQRSELAQALPIEVVRTALAQDLDDPARGGVPTGFVTFASMSSLRNLPFKVVCAIGLNDGAFPSGTQPAEFDLMALQPRRGDRQRRIDERNVFLDLLLAAREYLHLSYVGRSVRDNAPMPPSVLVAELLDYLVPAISADPADAAALVQARARLVVEHPLQPFSDAAFRLDADPRRRSFQREYAEALQRNLASPAPLDGLSTPATAGEVGDADDEGDDGDAVIEPAAPFIAAPLPEPGEEWRDVPLQRLLRFFTNPCRYLLEQRLGMALPRDEDALHDDEPFLPDGPGRSVLAARLLPALLDGADTDTVRSLACAGTELPAGALGRHLLEAELADLQAFAGRVIEATREPCLAPHAVSLAFTIEGEPWRVHAGFADVRSGGLLRYRFGDLRAADYVSAWLHHLMLCADAPAGTLLSTTSLGRDGQFRFRPCDEPHAVLQTLLGLYRRGLREPLYFFPKTAWAYVESAGKLSAATQAWRATSYKPHAEGADAAYRLALRGRPDPLGAGFDAFEHCAHSVLDPLRACLEPASPGGTP
jgi:exodeoxyribonuclease V gamma subunit